jgi:hypothetical protein
LFVVIAVLIAAPALPQDAAPAAPANLPVSLDRIRAALERSPVDPLRKPLLPRPNFRVEIRERQRFEELMATLDFRSGPVPPGGLYGFEQRARLSSPWGSQPIISVDLFSIGRLFGSGLSNARRARAEAAAREEVKRALDEFWLAQGKPPASDPR